MPLAVRLILSMFPVLSPQNQSPERVATNQCEFNSPQSPRFPHFELPFSPIELAKMRGVVDSSNKIQQVPLSNVRLLSSVKDPSTREPQVIAGPAAAIAPVKYKPGKLGIFMLGTTIVIAWFFVGIEALTYTCDQIDALKKVIPVAQLSCISTVFVTGVMVVFIIASLAPGLAELPQIVVPFDNGFVQLFKISKHHSALLSLPGAFATSFGFMWAYGKLIAALSTSSATSVLCQTKNSNTPYNALIIGSCFSYGLCLLVYFVPQIGGSFTGICMLSASMSYTGQCIGYIALKKNYRSIKSSEFKSPSGMAGAFVSLLIWLIMAISLLTIHDDGGKDAIGFALVVILFTVFYFGHAQKRQTFSPQDNKIMLVAHVTKFNIKKVAANRQQRHHKVSGSSSHTGGTEISLGEGAKKAMKSSMNPFSFSSRSNNSTKLVSVNPFSTRSSGSGRLVAVTTKAGKIQMQPTLVCASLPADPSYVEKSPR